MPNVLKRVKKPTAYIVIDRDMRVIGKAKRLSSAMKIAGTRKNVGIAQLGKCWERGTSRTRRKRRRRRRH
jgi:hypothetical protein